MHDGQNQIHGNSSLEAFGSGELKSDGMYNVNLIRSKILLETRARIYTSINLKCRQTCSEVELKCRHVTPS